jgi:hypothetical protein
LSLINEENKKQSKIYLYEAAISIQHFMISILTPVSHMVQFMDTSYFVEAANELISNGMNPVNSMMAVIMRDDFVKHSVGFKVVMEKRGIKLTKEEFEIFICYGIDIRGIEKCFITHGILFSFTECNERLICIGKALLL